MNRLIKDLTELMVKSKPFTGDRGYIRGIIDTLMKNYVANNKLSKLQELEKRINELSVKISLR